MRVTCSLTPPPASPLLHRRRTLLSVMRVSLEASTDWDWTDADASKSWLAAGYQSGVQLNVGFSGTRVCILITLQLSPRAHCIASRHNVPRQEDTIGFSCG